MTIQGRKEDGGELMRKPHWRLYYDITGLELGPGSDRR